MALTVTHTTQIEDDEVASLSLHFSYDTMNFSAIDVDRTPRKWKALLDALKARSRYDLVTKTCNGTAGFEASDRGLKLYYSSYGSSLSVEWDATIPHEDSIGAIEKVVSIVSIL